MKRQAQCLPFLLCQNTPKYNFPFLTCFVLSLQNFGGVNSKLKSPPFLTCFPARRSPSAYFEGTHGVRFAWGNTDAIDFVAIASSLRATNGRRAVSNTNRLKAVPLRFVRQLRTQTAQSLVLFVKLDARFLAALRLAFRPRIYRKNTNRVWIRQNTTRFV